MDIRALSVVFLFVIGVMSSTAPCSSSGNLFQSLTKAKQACASCSGDFGCQGGTSVCAVHQCLGTNDIEVVTVSCYGEAPEFDDTLNLNETNDGR